MSAPTQGIPIGPAPAPAGDPEPPPWSGRTWLLVGFWLWLLLDFPVVAIGKSPHDDALFVRQAASLVSLDWLGDYDNLTLAKGPFFPLFMAAGFLLGLPLILAEALVYLAGIEAVRRALAPVLLPGSLQLLFVLLLSNPIFVGEGRVVRSRLASGLALLVVGGFVGQATRWRRAGPAAGRFAALGGAALGCFALTRSDAAWILPAVLGLCALAGWEGRKDRPDSRRPWRQLLVGPAVGVAIYASALLANFLVYGVPVVDEMTSGGFARAQRALFRVIPADPIRRVPLPEPSRRALYAVSPAFARLQPHLEGETARSWVVYGTREDPRAGPFDVEGGWVSWCLRDAAAQAGAFRDAATADRFFRDVADEVERACADGRLACRRTAMIPLPRMTARDRAGFVAALREGLGAVSGFEGVRLDDRESEGDSAELMPIADMTRMRLAPRREARLRIKGWAFGPFDELVVEPARRPDGTLGPPIPVERVESPDVRDFFATLGPVHPSAGRARFTLEVPRSSTLVMRERGAEVGRVGFGARGTMFFGAVAVRLDEVRSLDRLPRAETLWELKSMVFFAAAAAYAELAPLAAPLVAVLVAISVLGLRRSGMLGAMVLSLGASVFAHLSVLALVSVTAFPAMNQQYLAPLYPVYLVVAVLACEGALAVLSTDPPRPA